MSRPRNSESVFRAIADPTRRKMFDLLRQRECPVSEVITSMRLRRNTASFHLGVLLEAGLVNQRRSGRTMVCAANPRALGMAHAWLGKHLLRAGERSLTS